MIRFIVDEMLGHLVRWLRILGFDTLSAIDLRESTADVDRPILLAALKEGRIVVTSDKQLLMRAMRIGLDAIYIEPNSDKVKALRKILEEFKAFNEARKNMFTRCPMCNGQLVKVEGKDISTIKDRIPEGVLKFHKMFWVCKKCGKIYWIGSHFRNIKRILAEVLNE